MATRAVVENTDIMAPWAAMFDASERRVRSAGQAWILPLRQAAMDRFAALGFPTTRDEDWRFTNIAPIARTGFRPADQITLDLPALAPHIATGLARLVLVNGRFAPALSALDGLPNGVRVGGLAQAIAADRALIESHLGRYAATERHAFTALNTALIEDGALIHMPRGTVLEQPIHVLHVAVPGSEPQAVHPRVLVLAGEESQASVVEEYVSLADGVGLTNAVTELVIGSGSVMEHYAIERENMDSFHIGTVRSQQGRSSSLTFHTVLLGGALVRRNIHPVLGGEGGECLINGLFMGKGRQHMDNYMYVEHASPHCNSRQVYKGILDEQAHGVFHGRILVHKDAQKTDAKQTNMNLLLSEGAQIDTKPQLEIYADDVKCTHGATIGQIDEDAIFYLRARGIPEASAKALLLYAFAGEMLDRMKAEPIRRRLEAQVRRWMPQGGSLEGMR
ncbi:MAG TPA: Fe-S cluster assembly protein SufD [Candidatus Baltobacteraceae bacterium]|nr:Fe-S cluster assembly protein SufD [Candidatus Baltobacteraceae bacterium]